MARLIIVVATLLPLALFVVITSGTPDTRLIYTWHEDEDPNPISDDQEYAHLVRRNLIKTTATHGFKSLRKDR